MPLAIRTGVVFLVLSSRLVWANPEDVRHVGDEPLYASLDTSTLRRGTSSSPLAPPPAAESTARLTTPPPVAIKQPRRWGVFGAGVALFGIGYAADAGLTYGMNHSPATTSLIPVVGPMLQLSQHYSLVSTPASTGIAAVDAEAQSAANAVNRTVTAVVTTGLVIDFAMQLAGVAMMIAGPTSHRAPSTPRKVSVGAGSLCVRF